MGDFQIGSDKIEHFFGRGYVYFNKFYNKKKSIEKIHGYGYYLERYQLGATMTGVYSYADLVANFNGMRFWNHILQAESDILGEDLGPYVRCYEGKWEQIKDVNWLDYRNYSRNDYKFEKNRKMAT